MTTPDDPEGNRLSARARRYADVGMRVGGVAARMAGSRLSGSRTLGESNQDALVAALGSLKGPMMKVAQFLATIPEALPPDLAEKLRTLQAHAPPMGAAFVARRMQGELGPDWRQKFASFELHPAHAASLGQVHRAVSHAGQALACKLQYPDMKSVVEADLKQLEWVFSLRRYFNGAVDTREMAKEIGARVREELDYIREARHVALYRDILCGPEAADTNVRVPEVTPELSTGRLLTLSWLEGEPLLDFTQASQEERNAIARAMFRAWWHPFIGLGIIHGDPHLGNYTVFRQNDKAAGINLLDYGCIRIFPPSFVQGVVDLYEGLRAGNEEQIASAYLTWGFRGLKRELINVLNIWRASSMARCSMIACALSPKAYRRDNMAVNRRCWCTKG